MELEQRLWREIEKTLTTTTTATTLSLKTLKLFQSLITNSTTSAVTITTVHQTLNTALSLSLHPHTHLHILSLLSTLPPHLSSSATAITTATATILISSSSDRVAAAALSLLLATPDFDFDSLDDGLIISICFRPCVAVRVWFLNNAVRFKIQDNLLVTVFLGFTKDPYPNVRQTALISLARVCESGVVEDCDVVEACYFCAVELLSDQEDYVRQAAVRAVGEWGRMVATFKQEGLQKDWFDAVFLQLCSTVRDMNVGVRVEAFTALAKFTCVSEDILLQALSKKLLGTVKEKQFLALRGGQYKIHASSAAGVFIHGLEDDFSEVQKAACITLRMLPVVSGQFAGEAVNIVSYVLNDDSIIVRLEALKTLHHMSMSECLKMKEEHVDMLLGTLVDSCLKVRSKAISIVGSVKLPAQKLSKMTVESLLATLDIYPTSKADIFHALFSMGQTNGHHSVNIIEDFYNEVEGFGDGKLSCNNNRVAGLIILALSTSLKHENYRRRIPQKVFSYAAAFFGQISHAFADILDADSLLQYLSRYGDWCSENQPVEYPPAKDQLQTPVHILDTVKIILATVKSLWGLVKSGCTSEVLRALRYCKGSLKTLRPNSIECAGAVLFALQFIHVVKLISKIWGHFITVTQSKSNQVGHLDILLAKLEKSLLSLRFRFTGLGVEDELNILELVLLSHVLTLSGFHVHCRILHKLRTTVAYVDHLRITNSIAFSDFLHQLSNLTSKYDQASPADLKKLCDVFILKDFALTQRIRQVNAEVTVIGFDSVTPLRFLPGLPVGVPLEINLYNVRTDHVIWIKLALVDEVTEFVFLDTEEQDDLQQIKFTSPFFQTPKSVGFVLRVSIGIECKSEELRPVKGYGGPKHGLTYICPELDVYFVYYG